MSNGRKKMTMTTPTSSTITCDVSLCNANESSVSTTTLLDTVQNGVLATFLTTAAQQILTDLLSSRRIDEDAIFFANQLVRTGILYSCFNTSVQRTVAAPFLQHFFYQLIKDENRYEHTETDPTAEIAAVTLTTCALLGYDIVCNTLYADATLVDSVSSSLAAVATNLVTKSTTQSAYQWIKNGLFGNTQPATRLTEEPKSRAWLSIGI